MGHQTNEELALDEMRHRLANSFQLMDSYVRLRMRRVETDEARRELGYLAEMIASLGALQEQLARPGHEDFAVFLKEAAKNWQRLLGDGQQIRFVVEAEPLRLDGRQASSLALGVHELVTNAVEHGLPDEGPGTVTISLRRVGQEAVLTVADDGDGFGQGTPQPGDGDSMGLRLVEKLCHELQGRFEIAHDGGIAASIRFPVLHA